MKKLPILLLAVFILAGCSGKTLDNTTTTTQTTAAETTTTAAAAPETTTETMTTAAEPVIATDAGPFNAGDLACNDMSFGCSYDLAQNWFGFPADTLRAGEDLEGNPIREMSFGKCRLIFTGTDFTLTEAQLNDATLAGPRGISVGDTLADIESMFGLGGDGLPYYEAENGLPPRAEKLAFEGDSTYLILLTAPQYAYTEDTLSQELAYMDLPHAQLVYTLDSQTDTILSIHWIMAPLGENR